MIIAITIFFLLGYCILFSFYIYGWTSTKQMKSTYSPNKIFVSVVIAARNEAGNIESLLHSLRNQEYPKHLFEVIIVDDHSTDNTTRIIREHAPDNVKLVQQEDAVHSKKKAIAKAIEMASGELIMATDADCILPESWITKMVDAYQSTGAEFIAGPVKFIRSKNLVTRFQSMDFLMLQGITAAGIRLDLHYMCNGANLAFTKRVFQEVNGYEGIDRVATGDDMLLMHKIKNLHPGSILFLKDPGAIVSTQPMFSWKDFFMQRKRWASKTFIYDDWRIIFVLGFVYLFNCWFFGLLAAGFWQPVFLGVCFLFILIKTLVEISFLQKVSAFYNEKIELHNMFLFQPLHIFYTVFIGLWSQVGKYEWKGRKLK